MRLILFPNQLFSPKELKKLTPNNGDIQIHLIEHTLFYGKRKYKYIANPPSKSPKAKPMKFNRRKIVFHRATMLHFIDECKQQDIKITFHESIDNLNEMKKELLGNKNKTLSLSSLDIVYFDPVDRELTLELTKTFPNAMQLDTPYFLFTPNDIYRFLSYKDPKHTKARDKITHSSFYKFALDELDIPFIKKSLDTENRDKFEEKDIPNIDYKTYDNKYIDKAKKWLEKSDYKDYPGELENWWLPIMRQGAEKQLQDFLKNDLKYFGKYQDAMVIQRPFLYHSRLSSLLNIGLLTPRIVVEETVKYYKKHRTKIPLSSFEGFIRQIIGWREYERIVYHLFYSEIVAANEFKNKRELKDVWYKIPDKTVLTPLDDAISQAWTYGYLHHIYRLMVVSNAMNLMTVKPYDAYRWFMEFATDSYDWVMIGNVYSMGMWADGGKTMRKPYISSNAYIEKMSVGYDEDKEWREKWRGLYYHFLERNSNVLKKTIYARNLGTLKRMKKVEKIDLMREARETIQYYTK